jgi:hypothetical protein
MGRIWNSCDRRKVDLKLAAKLALDTRAIDVIDQKDGAITRIDWREVGHIAEPRAVVLTS